VPNWSGPELAAHQRPDRAGEEVLGRRLPMGQLCLPIEIEFHVGQTNGVAPNTYGTRIWNWWTEREEALPYGGHGADAARATK